MPLLIVPVVAGAIIAGASALAGAGASALVARKNRKSIEKQNAIDRERQDSSILRAVQQQKQVGINPVTNEGTTPDIQADNMPAPFTDSTGISQMASGLVSLAGTIYQAELSKEVNEQNQALSFLQTQQTNAQQDVTNLEGLIEKADNDFKSFISTTDNETQEFFSQVETNRKDLSYKEGLVETNTELKTLLETLDKDHTLWRVDKGILQLNSDVLKNKYGVDIATQANIGLGLKSLGIDLKSGGDFNYQHEHNETEEHQDKTDIGLQGDTDKTTTRNSTDSSARKESSSWRKGWEKVKDEVSYSKAQVGREVKISKPVEDSYKKYIELRQGLVERHERSHSLLNRLRSNPNEFIQQYLDYIRKM